ncbi:hypothetical protein [Halomonas binhaiensis]|uniref:DUF3885 domain-containing protein n=1 Tax=Halomonas binhaiensis TaxID=2562282 RepID=A0A5C1NLH7_9GAMM|nr:hypothetical protein [Halomonas binhaiensis]QEM82669.1 hypothetical protein E4T21_14770 [Halomonas binhaiensis]
MEKLSKLINSSFSLDEIDFSGFSSSPGWVGYFELVDDFSFSQVDHAFELFNEFFNSSLNGFFILSALSYCDNKEDDNEVITRYGKYYEIVKEKKLIKPMTPEFESYLWGDRDMPANFLTIEFSNELIEPISKLIMCHAGIVGQSLFLVHPELNIVIYPHEDIGFGCISLNGDKSTAVNFLKHCQSSSSFRVTFG